MLVLLKKLELATVRYHKILFPPKIQYGIQNDQKKKSYHLNTKKVFPPKLKFFVDNKGLGADWFLDVSDIYRLL